MATESHSSTDPLWGLWRFRAYARPHLPVLSIGVGLRIGELLADLAQPWPLAVVVDSVLGHQRLGGIAHTLLGPFTGSSVALLSAAVCASVVLAGISGVFDYVGDRVMNGAGERITATIRSRLFAHLQRLPLSWHDQHSIGEISSRVITDTDRIEDALVDVFSTLLPGVLNVAGLLIVIAAVDWRLGLITLATVPLALGTFIHYTKLTRGAARQRRAREGSLSALVVETLSGIRTVHAFGRHDLHDQRFASGNRETLAAGLRSVDLRARFTPLVELVSALGAAVLLWVGAWGVLHHWWTLGVLLVVMAYLRNLTKPMRALSSLSMVMSTASAAAERVAAILSSGPGPTVNARVGAETSLRQRAQGRIELREVDFSYGRGPVLERLSLLIEPGERLALLGTNGTGKSSLLSLLPRLYERTGGAMLLDSQPVETLPVTWLRAQFAVVLQDTFLFSGTLYENIAYGDPQAEPADVLVAAERALVLDFARDLPDGLETVLGDHGTGLSGGQRQRVAIARALLRDAPVVLLDEPTSGLDLEAEAVVVEALATLVSGRTVIMATHRPALLKLATRKLTLRQGQILDGEVPAKFEACRHRTAV